MHKLREIECYTVSLLPKWCDLDCKGDKIDYFLMMVEDWYGRNFDDKSSMVWCWQYDPDFEYQDAGVVGIAFNKPEYAEDFKKVFGYVEQG